MDDLNEVIEVPADTCGLGGYNIHTFTLKCVHLQPSGDCRHPRFSRTGNGVHDVGCVRTSIMFVRKIDYINWKMSGGQDE